ncbi:Trigger factor [Fundidesulfovibrio magnetotacticus]|uniref:Trigger factor n=1 Tax=Fundidesulfovibrio magnetotacticus TaxID=2730080 RepID=A0A6V8LY20_9BACT|nr:trigger factor [Fundidesulfovibrio magnetotacticus]GFK94547.1 Trigger factor [Fundidesulfovibrio magnetotacticus]
MEYTVNDISPVETKVSITVPAEEVDASLAVTTALYRQNLDLRGFRKGKVPSSLVESKFRKQILREAANELMNVHINEIMSSLKYLAIAKLDVSPVELEKGKGIDYTLSFEHCPEFDLPEYKGLEVEEEEALASEEEIAKVIERIRGNLAELKVVKENRCPVDGDVAVVSFHATKDGEPVPGVRAENFQLALGEGQALPDFENLVKNTSSGATNTAPVSFPADFINQELAGKTVDMTVTVHVVKEKDLPPVDDELAQKAGSFESLEKLRDAISRSYVQSRQQLFKATAQKKLLDGLLEKVDFPLPPAMVEEQIKLLVEDAKHKIERTGKSPEALGKSDEDLRAEAEPKAKEIVKTQLFLIKLSDKEGIETTPQEMDAYFMQIASRTGQDVLAVKQHYEQNGLIIPVRDKLLADKAMDFVYTQAKVTKVPVKDPQAAEA